jgi:hypothetical protein
MITLETTAAAGRFWADDHERKAASRARFFYRFFEPGGVARPRRRFPK